MQGGQSATCYTVLQSKLDEHVIYADSRLGVYKHGGKLLNTNTPPANPQYQNIAGKRMYEIKNWLGSVISVVRDLKYWTKQDGQSSKVVYQSSFEGGDEAMFYPNPDGEYNRSTAQASSGTYSLYLNAHTHNGNHYGPNIMHSFVETGDLRLRGAMPFGIEVKLKLFKAYFEADNSTWNNDEGGRMVYELLDEQGGYLYTTTGTRQWRAVHINGDAQTWRSYNVNFTIPKIICKYQITKIFNAREKF